MERVRQAATQEEEEEGTMHGNIGVSDRFKQRGAQGQYESKYATEGGRHKRRRST